MDRIDLRYGLMAGIYYDIAGERLPRQLDLLDAWFPGLFVVEDVMPAAADHDNSRKNKPKARYDDSTFLIHAVRVGRSLYVGGSSERVSQIAGRLIADSGEHRL